jgi:ATP-dependent DNA helicase RecQ
LKALEQDGWLSFNEQVFLPSFVRFTTGKEYLYSFEQQNPSLEPLIKSLLRAYEGIFDYPTGISEKLLAGLLKQDIATINKSLLQLHQRGIIEYEPQKDKPQLLLLRHRIKAEDIRINMESYHKRKEQFLQRMKQMISYVKEQQECRSRLIGLYFGDDKIQRCGVCDNCLRQKATTLTTDEFDALHHRIINMVKYEPLHPEDLLLKLSGVKKEKAWKVISFLQAENKIEMDERGRVKLK